MNRKQYILTSIAILVAFVLGAALSNLLHVPSTQAQETQTIPKNFGTLKGGLASALIFEDAAGTIRIYELNIASRGRVLEFRRK
jgi:hypothetical protein